MYTHQKEQEVLSFGVDECTPTRKNRKCFLLGWMGAGTPERTGNAFFGVDEYRHTQKKEQEMPSLGWMCVGLSLIHI